MEKEYVVEIEKIEIKDDKKKKEKRHWILSTVLLVLLLLLLLTAWILLNRLGTFAATEGNSIFLVPVRPGFSVEDKEQVWGTETSFDLFKNEYYGIGRDITVESEDGSRLIAPGTESEYTFNLKNTGNVAMDYSVKLDVQLDMAGEEVSLEEFPLGVRLRHYSGEYLLGDGEHWASVGELEQYLAEDTLSVNNYAWYTVEWKWLFEEDIIDDHDRLQLNVGDALDTLLGNVSSETPVSLSASITTKAQPSANADAIGGVDMYADGEGALNNNQIGGRIRLWPLIVLFILIAIVAAAMGYYWAKNKKKRKEEEGAADEQEEKTPTNIY